MKIVTIVGARPQFIKAAAVSRVISKWGQLQEVLVHTGQHFDDNMSRLFFEELEIPTPKYQLGIHSLPHGAMTGRMIESIETVLQNEKPECVLIYGDTNSTLAAAVAASKLQLPVAHAEAGMRSFNLSMPEEINRIIADRLSKFLFCSTKTAVKNLENEGFIHFDCDILQTGDVMYDAALYYGENADRAFSLHQKIPFKDFVLCTLHRQENTDDPAVLKQILSALAEIHREIPVVLPLHPRTRQRITQSGISIEVHAIDPVGYLEMLGLTKSCRLVLTDSGGLQKEAFFFKKFCITLREETEWVELVELKVNQCAGARPGKILSAFRKFSGMEFKTKAFPYGKGNAAEKIVKKLLAISPA
jgi:UDP-GlcNAc3NAcA epimerase